jgi:hypothetical protein
MNQSWGYIINLLLPLLGVSGYLKLRRDMKLKGIERPPVLEYFLIFATYGSLLVLALTSFLWEWSGMASLGAFYLLIGAPIVMVIIAYLQFKNRRISKYHDWAFKIAASYIVIFPIVFFTVYKLVKD